MLYINFFFTLDRVMMIAISFSHAHSLFSVLWSSLDMSIIVKLVDDNDDGGEK